MTSGIGEDAKLASLVAAHQNANDLLLSFVKNAESMHGILSYEQDDELRQCYERILTAKDSIESEIAASQPRTLTALAIKMRVAFYCDQLSQAQKGCLNEKILYPALRDLERLANTA